MKPSVEQKCCRIAGFQETSLIDWDEKVSAVVFLSGCGWRCPFCHNSALIEKTGGVDEEEVIGYLRSRSGWIDGVVLLGGEPLYSDDVFALAAKIKDEGFPVKLDTNGSRPDRLGYMIDNGLVDYVAMDIKTRLTPEKYPRAAGSPQAFGSVWASLEILISSGCDFELRTTAVPTIVSPEDLLFNSAIMPEGTRYVIQQFKPDNAREESLRSTAPYQKEVLTGVIDELKDKGVISWLRS